MSDFTTWRSLVDGEEIGVIPDLEGLHEWLFDEGQGGTAQDRVGDADFDLTSIGWESGVGVGDYVIDFGGDGHMTVADHDLDDWGDSGGVIMQIYPRDESDFDTFYHQTNDDRVYMTYDGGDDDWIIGIGDIAGDTFGLGAVNWNEWNGIALFWDNGDFDAYHYDFATESMTSVSDTYGGTVVQNGDFTIGSEPQGANPDMNGDFPRIYDSYLSSPGVKDRFESLIKFYD